MQWYEKRRSVFSSGLIRSAAANRAGVGPVQMDSFRRFPRETGGFRIIYWSDFAWFAEGAASAEIGKVIAAFSVYRTDFGLESEAVLSTTAVTDDTITISPGSHFRAAMVLAIIADALQIIVFPVFVEGALSPTDDLLDFGIAAVLVHLLGWHWEFLPSFLAKLVPGVDLVPFWTVVVANVIANRSR